MQTRQIDIEWLTDTHECDTCGMTGADGATIRIDGKEVICLEPSAYCYDSDSWNEDEVFGILLGQMGVRAILQDEHSDPRDISRGRSSDEIPPLADDAIEVLIETFTLRDDESDDYSEGYRATCGEKVLIEKLPCLLGADKSPYFTTSQALVSVAEYFGAHFSAYSIPNWVAHEKE